MSIRTLKIRRSTAVDESQPSQSAPTPAASDAAMSVSTRVAPRPTPSAQMVPLEPPYDRQCIIRFPPDIAAKVKRILTDAGTTELTEVIRVTMEKEQVNGVDYRVYSISVFEHQRQLKQFDMKGILVDLPTFVESYKTVNNGVTLTKSADISQMLICFKREECIGPPFTPELQKAMSLLYPSGLTPPTSRIRYRKFRSPPTPQDVQHLRSAEDLVENVMSGGALEWVIETEVDEDEAIRRAITEPENVWTPTEEILQQLRQAGYIDENGDLIGSNEEEELEPVVEGPIGGKGIRGKFH